MLQNLFLTFFGFFLTAVKGILTAQLTLEV